MTPLLKRYRDIAIVVVLLAVPFYFLRANMRPKAELNAMDRAVLRISAPIQYGAAQLARGISNLVSDFGHLFGVKEENERLSYENARLKEDVHRLEGLEVENQELRRLLQLRQTTPGETVSALVIGKDFNEFFRVTRVVLDRGSRDVRANMPVISPDGVVGKVLHVAGDSLDVQLAVDAAFGIDVEDERTHARGFVRGTGDPARYACRVEMVAATDEVETGDLLVTSGKGKWFPHGLPVGRVTKVQKRELGRDQDVEATPTVNFSRLDSVLVLVTPTGEDGAPDEPTQPGKSAARGDKPAASTGR